jgi:hypothetical protein
MGQDGQVGKVIGRMGDQRSPGKGLEMVIPNPKLKLMDRCERFCG